MADVDDVTAKARALRDNRHQGDWVNDRLGALLEELSDSVEPALLGFDEAEIERILLGATADLPPAPETATTAPTSGNVAPDSAAPPGDPGEDRYREQYGVIVICPTELDQEETYERLKELLPDFEIKVVTT